MSRDDGPIFLTLNGCAGWRALHDLAGWTRRLALFTNQMPDPSRPDVNLPGKQPEKHGLQLL
jgi:hypothetical protein